MIPSIFKTTTTKSKQQYSKQSSPFLLLTQAPIKQKQPQNNNNKNIAPWIRSKTYTVYKIQDSQVPIIFPPQQSYSPLPNTVQFNRIIFNVIASLQSSYFRTIKATDKSQQIAVKWTQYLRLQQNRALVSDCFWYAICRFFKQGQHIASQKQLQSRIAKNYIALFLSIQDKRENQQFFKQYFNVLSQSVFYSFFYAYPKSRSRFNEQLKDNLLRAFSLIFTGIQISNTKSYYQKWTLDLGTGNILAKKSKNQMCPPIQQNTFKKNISIIKSKVGQKPKKRQTLSIRYSPIVQLYLKNNKYKTRNYVSQFKMKYTQSDKSLQNQIKFAAYSNQAARISQWSKKMRQQQQAKRIQLQNQIKAIKRQTINHHKRLDRRKAEQLQRGAHQYANYLVSMLNAGITMTSLGVIRKNLN